MRRVMLGFAVAVVVVAGVGWAQQAPAPMPWLAVETCSVIPTEGQALRAALREYVDYITANPVELPGRVLGGYRQRVTEVANFHFILEVEGIAQWTEFQAALRAALRSDEERRTLRQAFRSHFVPQSCEWSFHQRWP